MDPKYHPKIIGRKGVIIDRIRKDHEVQIQVPSTRSGGDDGSDVITLTGYERNCIAAKEEIERMVKELVRSLQSTILIHYGLKFTALKDGLLCVINKACADFAGSRRLN